MKRYVSKQFILRTLFELRQASVPGKTNDGARIRIRYKPFREPTKQALQEARAAQEAHLDLNLFTGHLDRVWMSSAGDLIVTMLALERLSGTNYTYRSFNLKRGEIQELIVLD